MSNLNLSEAFAQYGAKLANPQWAVSAMTDDGALLCHAGLIILNEATVVYAMKIPCQDGAEILLEIIYADRHVADAFNNKLPVRLVIATADDTTVVDSGNDASKVKKTFHTRPDMIGRITHFDGDKFIIDFQRNMA